MLSRLVLSLLVALLLTVVDAWGTARSATVGASSQNHVHSILIAPNNPNVLYLGAHYRLYSSTDGGVHWKALFSQMMLSMTLDPARPHTMYAVSQQGGFLRSTDGGAHWNAPRGRPTKGSVIGVAFDPASKVLIAYGNGIYRSADGGTHWARVLSGQSITSCAVGMKAVFAASANGLYVSQDRGKHWTAVASVGSQPILQTVATGHVGYAVGAISVLKSTDDGRRWKELPKAPQGVEFLGVAPSNPNEIFAEVGGQGFYASRNGGRSWSAANAGIHDKNFASSVIRVAPSSPNVAYTGAWGLNFYATRDGGRHWKKTSSLIH